jgi:phosphoglycolate phosphatase
MIDNIIFDLDGTLVNSVEGIQFALEEAISRVMPGHNKQLNNISKKIGAPIYEIIKDSFPKLSNKLIIEIEQQFRLIYDSEGWKKTILFESTMETLEGLSQNNVRMFVATNKPSKPTTQILTLTGIRPYFIDFVSAPNNKSQNKSSLINILIQKHNLIRSNTLMVGDAINDAIAAKSCNLDFAFASYGFGEISELESFSIKYKLDRPIDLLHQIVKGKEL